MRSFTVVSFLLLSVFVLTGCAAHGTSTMQSPAVGFLYNETSGPGYVTNLDGYDKVGTAKAESILGLVGTGDASIKAAMEDGNITQIHSVDVNYRNVLGVIANYETVVRGK